MSILKEFQQFAVRGNVIDLAIGVVIGTAFGKIVSSLVGDVISPLLGRLVGGISFVDWQVSLGRIPGGEGELMLRFGAFLQAIFDFVIIAVALFMAIKALNRLRTLGLATAQNSPEPPPSKPDEPVAAAAAPDSSVQLLTEIRDLLKAQRTPPG
jgi:large conductance mechanosensitive channel